MRDPYERDIKKELLENCFKYLVLTGLDNVSIRNLCDKTGFSSGSIYYWFKDKDELVLDATEYGLNQVCDELFNYAFSNVKDINKLIKEFPKKISSFKNELRFVYQVTTGIQYGEKMRLVADKLKNIYNIYTDRLSIVMNVPVNKLKPMVYLFISAVLDYVIWEDNVKLETELNYIQTVIITL